MRNLPFSAAAENNKGPILGVLRQWFQKGQVVLEIGSGTGQHAVHFASSLEGITWLPSETPQAMADLRARLDHCPLANLRQPIALDVMTHSWDGPGVDHVFSANTAHIMTWDAVCSLFAGVARILRSGVFVLYGPFNRDGAYTSAGNRAFDRSLRSRNAGMGIRNDADLVGLASQSGMALVADIPMPANNRILIWRRTIAPECGNADPA